MRVAHLAKERQGGSVHGRLLHLHFPVRVRNFLQEFHDVRLREFADGVEDDDDVVGEEPDILGREVGDDVIDDAQRFPEEGEVAFLVQVVEDFDQARHGFVDHRAGIALEIAQALQLLQEVLQVVDVAQEPFQQAPDVFQGDVGLQVGQFLG